MTKDVGAKIWHIGRDLQSRVRGFFDNPPGPDATPLELFHAALDDLERRGQPAGRGRRIFPYDRIAVRIVQAKADRVAIEAVFDQLVPRLRERLEELRCEQPDVIVATVTVSEPSADDPDRRVLTVECSGNPDVQPASPQDGYPRLTITVLKGQCRESEFVFEEPFIAIGRTDDPTDAYGQVRHNHVAFLEERDGITETVGRAHARIQYDRASGSYYVFHEAGSNPTSILRRGTTIRVAPRDPRGIRLQSGDQLQLGRAVLQVTVGSRELEAGS
jgi:hypothetical protein